jgi:hypothetical protein
MELIKLLADQRSCGDGDDNQSRYHGDYYVSVLDC